MKWSASLKIALKTMRSAGLLWCTLLAAISAFWILKAADGFILLAGEKNTSVTLNAEGSAGTQAINEVLKLKNVEAVSELKVQTGRLSFGEYFQEVTVCGVAQDYLNLIGENDVSAFSGAMPYVFLSEESVDNFENEDKEKMSADSGTSLLMEKMRLTAENVVDVRIAGFIKETYTEMSSETEDTAVLGGFKKLGSLYMTLDWFDKLWPAEATGENEAIKQFVVRISDGTSLEAITEELIKLGFIVKDDYSSRWEKISEESFDALYKGFLALLCAVLIGFYEWKLWLLKHQKIIKFMNWLSEGKKLTKIWICRYSLMFLMGLAAAFIYWGGMIIFGAE